MQPPPTKLMTMSHSPTDCNVMQPPPTKLMTKPHSPTDCNVIQPPPIPLLQCHAALLMALATPQPQVAAMPCSAWRMCHAAIAHNNAQQGGHPTTPLFLQRTFGMDSNTRTLGKQSTRMYWASNHRPLCFALFCAMGACTCHMLQAHSKSGRAHGWPTAHTTHANPLLMPVPHGRVRRLRPSINGAVPADLVCLPLSEVTSAGFALFAGGS